MRVLPNCIVVALSGLAMAGIAQAQDGAALYRTYCAICHEGPSADARAPGREMMKRMSAEQALESLEKGSMRARVAERSRAQRRALAEYVAEKRLGTGSDRPSPKSAFCAPTSPPSTNPLAGPHWNGWANGLTNTRFQSAKAAGLAAGDVSRLQL